MLVNQRNHWPTCVSFEMKHDASLMTHHSAAAESSTDQRLMASFHVKWCIGLSMADKRQRFRSISFCYRAESVDLLIDFLLKSMHRSYDANDIAMSLINQLTNWLMMSRGTAVHRLIEQIIHQIMICSHRSLVDQQTVEPLIDMLWTMDLSFDRNERWTNEVNDIFVSLVPFVWSFDGSKDEW